VLSDKYLLSGGSSPSVVIQQLPAQGRALAGRLWSTLSRQSAAMDEWPESDANLTLETSL
jgi:hypothetical protein